MAGNTPQARTDPMSIMRMVLAHKRVAQSPFSQLQEAGTDLLAQPQGKQPQNPFVPQAKPLVPNPGAQAESVAPKVQAGADAPRAVAPALVKREASFTPPPGPVQGPMPTTPFQDRLGDVTQAIAQGTFDPSGQNFTTYGPDMHGEGHTPAMRFIDAAAKSAGVDPQQFNYKPSDEGFIKGLTEMPINLQAWDRMMAGTVPSQNIEDRRDPTNLEGDQIGDLLREMDQLRRGGEGR